MAHFRLPSNGVTTSLVSSLDDDLPPFEDAMDIGSDDGRTNTIITHPSLRWTREQATIVTAQATVSPDDLPPKRLVPFPPDLSASATPSTSNGLPPKPSDVKGSLLARQKMLEERIARGRMEIAARSVSQLSADASAPIATTDNTQSSGPSSSVVSVALESVDNTARNTASDMSALRQLVKASKKTKTGASHTADVTPDHNASSLPLKTIVPITPRGSSSSPEPFLNVTLQEANLDDLATSFITDSIQSAVVLSPPSPPLTHPLPARPTPMPTKSSEKVTLAAKQAALDKHITESKLLMAKLSTAKTKAEKDLIMAELRASSKRAEEAMEAYSTASAASTPMEESKRPFFPSRKSTWPKTKDVFVLELSDEEDDD